ncbi:phospholipase D-like domain-containing protein [Peredibacter starrii]|uniref:Phosphatidylserine/phosphatidylglycerophosphate/ cardiolipin synthase family protein n=1 Tax=Peredibacter starrii TaxID=28202 RepID=A0AAX4HUJ2_9BACT|nr:phosphatidylserine/phosphatidylglycerophosphate/cardiolipin synthase family protein [Peredibacter starrii]WPU66753.1 phosphatidylserine/phosphatidylglycerophosphate/cardiolipin synthase family protein [Peredibacter starrii]
MSSGYFLGLLTVALFAPSIWGATNPFAQYQKDTPSQNSSFFPQTPPFKYPFTISAEVKNSDLDVQKILLDFPVDTLDRVSELYRGIPFNSQKSMYEYPFAIHPTWEYLPYPFIKSIPRSNPEQWISHFSKRLNRTVGINSSKFQDELDALTGTEAVAGNELRVLKTPASYAEILARVEMVKSHAFISSFLFNCDKGTESLVSAIGRKARTAKIYVMYDAFGAKSDPACSKRLEQLGAKVVLFKTKLGTIFHEKMYVFDGQYAMVDGQNLIAAGTLSNGTNNLFNDVAVLAAGPIVTKIGSHFIDLWESQGQKIAPEIKEQYLKQNAFIRPYASKAFLSNNIARMRDQGLCRLVTKSPGKNQQQILNLYLHTARNVNSYLFFNYIDPKYRDPARKDVGEKFIDAVLERVNFRKEIRVDMLTNGWKNPFQVELPEGMAANRNLMTQLILELQNIITTDPHKDMAKMHANLGNKVKTDNFHWWSYPQYMHAKTLMADNAWTIIGSYNINEGSEYQSYESVLACLDTELAQGMQESIILDAMNSIPVPLK